MKFIDETMIIVAAGKGGDGMVSFAAARNRPKLGPDGGDGGFGGDVILEGDEGLNTLSNFRYKKRYAAENGARGGSNGKTGRDGEDVVLRVPIGTQVFDADTGRMVGEVLVDDEHLVVAKGGKRGMGNLRWLTPTHQAPEEHTAGAEGERFNLRLELKLIADVGLAGFPNAGKSTLLSCLSAARPKVADYPFTTLAPTLGVVELPQDHFNVDSFVMADIPGLIEGAAEGRGLGHAFLRHIERTKILLYLLDPFNPEELAPRDALNILRSELIRHDAALGKRRSLVVLSKADLADESVNLESLIEPIGREGFEVMIISAVQQKGLLELKRRLMELVREERARGPEVEPIEGGVHVDRS